MMKVTLRVVLIGSIAASSSCSATPAPPAQAPGASGTSSQSAAVAAGSAEPGAPGGPVAPSEGTSVSSAARPSTLAGGNAKEDAHWVQADDYFVATREFEKGWLVVHIGKMKEPPAAGAKKGEALFFLIKDGQELRSAHYYRTRPAVQADLALGSLLICFDDNKAKKVYLGPRDKDNARPGGWWLARITDISDLSKGYVTLAGSYHCAPEALRAIVE